MTSFIEVPFDLVGNRILVKVENRECGPLTFVLDTGAEFSKIDKALAECLGLEFAHIRLGTVRAANVRGLKIPGVDPGECPWMEAEDDLAPVDGLIGGDILGRYIVEIDYLQKSARFCNPPGDKPPVGSKRLQIRILQGQVRIYVGNGAGFATCFIDTNRPYVDAELIVSGSQLCRGRFLIDTGNPPAFILSEAFTRKHRFLKALRKVPDFCPLAAYGDGKCDVGRLEGISIGDIGLNIASPLVHFYQEPMWKEDYDGIIGGEVLRRFRIRFDYDNKQMILEPNKDFDMPYEFDMSGTYLKPIAEGFELWKLIGDPSDSPAVEAGLKEGDVIIAINGKPHSEFTCDQVDQMFIEEGKEYRLDVSRRDRVFTTCIRTRRLM